MSDSIKVRVTNRWVYLQGYYPDELSKVFSYAHPNAFHIRRFMAPNWDGRVHLIKRRRIATGAFFALQKEAIDAGFRFSAVDERIAPIFRKKNKEVKSKRKYQRQCLAALIKHSNSGGLILSATGTGKTYIAGSYFKRLKGTGCFVVDELTLLEQARVELEKHLGERVGVIGDQKFDPERITVATVQTLHLHRRDPRFANWQKHLAVMFIDEIHQQINKRNLETIASIKPLAVFGLTATLQLKKREVFCKVVALAGPIIYTYPLKQGVEEGYLTPGVCIGLDLVRSKHKDVYDYQSLYKIHVVRSKTRNDMLEELVREAVDRGKFVILLLERVAHVQKMFDRLSDLRIAKAHGTVKVTDRLKAQARFESGKLQVIIANKVFKKGISINRVDVIIDGASMKSKNDAVQKYGRLVRLMEGKRGGIYIDVGEHVAKENRQKGSKKHSLEVATGSRRRAIKEAGITVIKMDWDGDAEFVYDTAEKALDKVLLDLKRIKKRRKDERRKAHKY